MKVFSGRAAVAVGLMSWAAAPLLAQERDPELYDGGESDFGVQYVEEKGLYFGFGVGIAKSNQNVDDFNDAFLSLLSGFEIIPGGSAALEDSDTAFSLTAGYNFNENLGAEISYINFGTVEYRASAQVQMQFNTPLIASSAVDIETQGIALRGVGRLPISDAFAVRTRLGVIFTQSEVDLSANLPSGAGSSVRVSGSDSSNDTNLFASIGATYSFENRWTVSLDYEILKRTGDDDFLDDIGTVSLGLAFRL